jgi:hypothetical protein
MTQANPAPCVAVFSQDLFLRPGLEDGLSRLGYQLWWIEDPAQLGATGKPPPRQVELTEPLEGPDAAMLTQVVKRRPALLLFDISSDALPWERWVQRLKTSAASRRLPLLAFGPHLDKAAFSRAQEAGADGAVSRGELATRLPQVLDRWARKDDPASRRLGCMGSLSPLAAQGVEAFNRGEYFEAHESLERAWRTSEGSEAELYRSLVQVAVICLHIQRGNIRGAAKVLLRLHQWLDPLPAVCRGLNVAGLRASIQELNTVIDHSLLSATDGIGLEHLKPIRFASLDGRA